MQVQHLTGYQSRQGNPTNLCLLAILNLLSSSNWSRPLGNHFPSIEFDQHGRVSLQIFHLNSEAEVVEKQELDFKVIQLGKGKAADLSGTSVSIVLEPWGHAEELPTEDASITNVPWHISSWCRTRPRRICSHMSHRQL